MNTKVNPLVVTWAVLAMSMGASAATPAGAGNVCAGQGSPPSGFPSCVWSIPVQGGEVLLDTAGSASAAEVRQALAEGRAPNLAPHVMSDEEGALAVEALLLATGSLSDVIGSALPTYELPSSDEQVSVLAGTLRGAVGSSGQEAMSKLYFYNWGNGHFTIIFEFENAHDGFGYDSKGGWFILQ